MLFNDYGWLNNKVTKETTGLIPQLKLLWLAGLSMVQLASFATIFNSTQTGDWDDPDTWNQGGAIPGCGDTIYVESADTVTVTNHVNLDENSTPACSTATFIYIYGTLHFQSGKKMYLACGSGVILGPGGKVTAGGGGGSSNLIDICQSTVWDAGTGDQTGPLGWGTNPSLPIELIYFEAHINGDKVVISWATATEINNDYFVIEKTINGFDFTEVIITDGAGNSNSTITYFEVDFSPWAGVSYYRLKQVDFDGTFSYSPLVAIDFNGIDGPGIELFPNPVQEENPFNLGLYGFNMQEVVVVVRDITGKEFYSEIVVVEYEEQFLAIDPQGRIPAGNYLVTATSMNHMYSKQLVVIK